MKNDERTYLGPMETPKRREEALDQARKLDLAIQYATPSVLMLDLDTKQLLYAATRAVGLFSTFLKIAHVSETRSPGGNWHWYCHLTHPIESRTSRIAWEALLGSDITHQALAMTWVQQGHAGEKFFFEMKSATFKGVDHLWQDLGTLYVPLDTEIVRGLPQDVSR